MSKEIFSILHSLRGHCVCLYHSFPVYHSEQEKGSDRQMDKMNLKVLTICSVYDFMSHFSQKKR